MRTPKLLWTVAFLAALLSLRQASAQQVEIKFTILPADLDKAIQALDLNNQKFEQRTVAFFDTENRALFNGSPSLILRGRSKGAAEWETTVKLRAPSGGSLDPKYQSAGKNQKREWDQVIGADPTKRESFSIDAGKDNPDVKKAVTDGQDIKKAFSKEQEKLVEENAASGFTWKDLVRYGPMESVKVWKKLSTPGFPHEITAERWDLPERKGKAARTILELSIKVPLADGDQAAKDFAAVLKKLNLRDDPDGETKTRTVMEHFAP
ncbi:MAG TPA: hypothetical protein VD994_06030 [Prosthecobacter sp.]|nr:hypothetical protein [Prosthecobacter sp.]